MDGFLPALFTHACAGIYTLQTILHLYHLFLCHYVTCPPDWSTYIGQIYPVATGDFTLYTRINNSYSTRHVST